MHRKLELAFASFIFAGAAACGDEGTTTFTDPDLVVTTDDALADGAEDQTYEVTLRAEGGTGEGYRWSVIQGQLPTNVFLTSSGTPETVISGTPRNNGRFTFTVQVEDSNGNLGTKAFSLNIEAAPPPVAIVTDSLPEGATETDYSETVMSENGSGEGYRWTLVQGGLPTGLSFSSEGQNTAITGTPEVPGDFSFRLRVEDSNGDADEQSFTIEIVDSTPPIELRTNLIPDGQVGVPFSPAPPEGGPVIIESAGGKGVERTWSVVNGRLPPGIELAVDVETPRLAQLSGVPTETGDFSFRVRVQDEDGGSDEKTFFTRIVPASPPLRIVTIEIPNAAQNEPYETELRATNGADRGYMWEILSGTLPPGLTIEAEGTPSTRIFGTPTMPGDYAFVVQVTDELQNTATFLYSIMVAAEIIPISITTSTLPDGSVGEDYLATISAVDGFGPYNWVVSEGTFPVGLELQVPGTPMTQLSGIVGEEGTFTATVTVYDLNNVTASRSFTFDVVDNAPALQITTTAAEIQAIPAASCSSYDATITAEGGSRVNYTWSIDPSLSDPLPAGFVLDPTGTPSTRLRSTPTDGNQGTYNLVFRVEDSTGRVDTLPVTLEVAQCLRRVFSFESDLEGWSNPDGTYGWRRDSGGTTSSFTGPTTGHDGSTWYVYMETSSGQGPFATSDPPSFLVSPVIPSIPGAATRNMSFFYHMYGEDMGTLNVDVSTDNGTSWTNVFSLAGQQQTSQSDPYREARVDLAAFAGDILIRFRGEATEGGFESDMAVDDITVLSF